MTGRDNLRDSLAGLLAQLVQADSQAAHEVRKARALVEGKGRLALCRRVSALHAHKLKQAARLLWLLHPRGSWRQVHRHFATSKYCSHVVLRLLKRRDAVVLTHAAGASVVGGQGKCRVAKGIKLLSQVTSAAGKVLQRISRVNAEIGSRAGHELGKAIRAGRRRHVGLEAALLLDDAHKQVFRHAVAARCVPCCLPIVNHNYLIAE